MDKSDALELLRPHHVEIRTIVEAADYMPNLGFQIDKSTLAGLRCQRMVTTAQSIWAETFECVEDSNRKSATFYGADFAIRFNKIDAHGRVSGIATATSAGRKMSGHFGGQLLLFGEDSVHTSSAKPLFYAGYVVDATMLVVDQTISMYMNGSPMWTISLAELVEVPIEIESADAHVPSTRLRILKPSKEMESEN